MLADVRSRISMFTFTVLTSKRLLSVDMRIHRNVYSSVYLCLLKSMCLSLQHRQLYRSYSRKATSAFFPFFFTWSIYFSFVDTYWQKNI